MANNGVITSAVNAQDQKAVQQKEAVRTMRQLIDKMHGEIKNALPSVLTPERFTRMVLSALSTKPELAECTPRSSLAAMMGACILLGYAVYLGLQRASLRRLRRKW